MEDLLLTLQLGCGVHLDERQALRLGKFIKDLQAEHDALASQVKEHAGWMKDFDNLMTEIGHETRVSSIQDIRSFLADHDAEVASNAVFLASNALYKTGKSTVNTCDWLNEYAAQLRAKAKP